MTDSISHFYINLEQEKERIINTIRDLELKTINSQAKEIIKIEAADQI